MSLESHRQYVKRLIAEQKCCRCRGPQEPDRIGKQQCRKCSVLSSQENSGRVKALVANGICAWCRGPIERDRLGMKNCRECVRLDNTKRKGDRETRSYVCSLCRKQGHNAKTCEKRAERKAAA